MTLSYFEEKWQNDWKWHKMTLKMIEKDMNEWNWLLTSETSEKNIWKKVKRTTDKASIDGVEGGKTPAAQQCGLENPRKKVPKGASCRWHVCLHPVLSDHQISL